ncbi:MAG: alpha/beta hydrolase [Myxococcales bacterium]|nr:alpha/beta hydrolase [Myxococcales bacterium]
MKNALYPLLMLALLLGACGTGADSAADDDDNDDASPAGDDDNDDDNDNDDNDDDTAPPALEWVSCNEFYPLEYRVLIPPDTACGTVAAPVDWENDDGRRLAVRFAVVPAADAAATDVLAVHLGGPDPNLRNVILLGLWPEGFLNVELRENFTLLFVESRGSSLSSTPLVCPDDVLGRPYADPDEYRALVRECLEGLPTDVSPARLSTAAAARDFARVRAALGLDTIKLYGNSYGTRLFLEYLRLDDAHVAAYLFDSLLAPQGTGRHDLDRILKTLAADCDAVADCPYSSGAALWAATDEFINGPAAAGAPTGREITMDLFHLGDEPRFLARWPMVLAAGAADDWAAMKAWHQEALILREPPTELGTDGETLVFDPYSDNTMCLDFPGWNVFSDTTFVLSQLSPPYIPLDQIEWMTAIDCEELARLDDAPPQVDRTPVATALPGLLIAPRLDQATPWTGAAQAVAAGLSGGYVVPVNADHAVLFDLGGRESGVPLADQQCLRQLAVDWLREPFDPFSRPCVQTLAAPLPIENW